LRVRAKRSRFRLSGFLVETKMKMLIYPVTVLKFPLEAILQLMDTRLCLYRLVTCGLKEEFLVDCE